jgi:hypothetical protein
MLVREVTPRLRSRAAMVGFCVGLLLAGAGAIWFVDVVIPLQASRWRPSGLAAPLILCARQISARALRNP